MRFRLVTFGGLRLEAGGDVVSGPPAQRRRLALLALLTASEQQKLTREKAFGYLWPEQSTSRARHLLSESLYVLRRLMGEDAILNAQDDLVLNGDVVWSDVAAFQEGLANGGGEDVLSLYRGPFLDGFHLKDAPEFELWADTLRDRLSRRFARALESLAESAGEAGDTLAAVDWWGRLAAHDPYSSRVAGKYMEALANAGERARALQVAGVHARRLHAELGVSPDPEFQATLVRLQQSLASTPADASPSPSRASEPKRDEPAPLVDAPLAAPARILDLGEEREPVRSGGSRRAVAAVAALGALAVVALLAPRYGSPAPSPALGAVKALTFEPGVEIQPSLSPDGRYIAYSAGSPGRIYIRQQGSRPILVTADSGPHQYRPRWSPDGTRLAFDAGHRIFVVPALGGVPQQIVADGWSPTWSPDGRRIAYARGDTIFTADVQSGARVPLAIVIQPAELAWSPDGRWIALSAGNDAWDGFVHVGNIAQSRILLIAADDGRFVEVTDRRAMNVAPTWSPDSRRLLFISNRAGARDVYAVHLGSDGQPVSEPTRLSTGLDAHSLALSASGDRLVYAAYHGRVNIWKLPIPEEGAASIGDAVALTTGNQLIESISVSPDRRWLYFTSDRSGNSDIWRIPLAGGEPAQVTRDMADEFAPEQSPDGNWLAYYSIRGGTRDIWVMPTGTGEPVQLTDDPADEHSPHWSPDGRTLCYTHHTGRGGSLEIVRRRGTSWSTPIVLPDAHGSTNQQLDCAGWLPDGSHIVVRDWDRNTIALIPADGGKLQVLYSADPGRGWPRPVWVRVDPRTGTIYFRDWVSIWALEPGNTEPRQIVRFDDPARRSTRIEMDADGDNVYFSLGDPQSDLFVAELSGWDASGH